MNGKIIRYQDASCYGLPEHEEKKILGRRFAGPVAPELEVCNVSN